VDLEERDLSRLRLIRFTRDLKLTDTGVSADVNA